MGSTIRSLCKKGNYEVTLQRIGKIKMYNCCQEEWKPAAYFLTASSLMSVNVGNIFCTCLTDICMLGKITSSYSWERLTYPPHGVHSCCSSCLKSSWDRNKSIKHCSKLDSILPTPIFPFPQNISHVALILFF